MKTSILIICLFTLLFSLSATADPRQRNEDQTETPGGKPLKNSSKPSVKLANSATSGVLTYVYDGFGRLSQVKDGSKVLLEYQYDDAGNRSQVVQTQ